MENSMESKKRCREGMALARVTRNQVYLAESLGMWALLFSDNAPETIRHIAEAHEISEKLGNTRMRAFVLWVYGGIKMQSSNYDRATPMIQEALRLSQLLKDKHRTAHCLLLLGRLATQQATYDAAIPFVEESLQILRDLSDRTCSGQALWWLGWNAYLGGNASRAIEYIGECLFIFREIESPYIYVPLVFLGRVATSQGNIPQAKSSFLEALERMKTAPEWIYILAHCMEGVCALPDMPLDKAARLWGKAEAIRAREALVIPISERPLIDPIIEKLQLQLGKESLDSARAAGETLTYQQTIVEAIEVLQSME